MNANHPLAQVRQAEVVLAAQLNSAALVLEAIPTGKVAEARQRFDAAVEQVAAFIGDTRKEMFGSLAGLLATFADLSSETEAGYLEAEAVGALPLPTPSAPDEVPEEQTTPAPVEDPAARVEAEVDGVPSLAALVADPLAEDPEGAYWDAVRGFGKPAAAPVAANGHEKPKRRGRSKTGHRDAP